MVHPDSWLGHMTQPAGKKKKEHLDSWLGQTAQMARKNRKGPTGPKHAQLARKEKRAGAKREERTA
jgi:hypothetical protein